MRRGIHPGVGWLLLALLAAGPTRAALGPAEVVVVANQRLTNSVALARHYLAARGIPEINLVLVALPEQETLARGVYETALRDPLLATLRSRGLIEQVQRAAADVRPHETAWQTVKSSVRAVVCMRGVPLRIASTQHPWLVKAARRLDSPFYGDGAAVDSELALLLADSYPLAGRVANPAYRHLRLAELGESAHKLLIATRLDAADDATVRRMMDDAVAVERTGLEGRAYFDLRAAREDGYALGDFWMEESAERVAREGVECVVDRHDGIFGPAYPMEAPVYYLGWYTEEVVGPFLRPDFRFAPGAIAYHLHSASARSLRDPRRYWAAPLLAAGACATMGAVDEPLLGLTPDLQVCPSARARCWRCPACPGRSRSSATRSTVRGLPSGRLRSANGASSARSTGWCGRADLIPRWNWCGGVCVTSRTGRPGGRSWAICMRPANCRARLARPIGMPFARRPPHPSRFG